MKNSVLFDPAPAGDSFHAIEPETASHEIHDTDDHCCWHCGGTGFDSGFTLEEADQPMPCIFCGGTGRSDGTGEPAGIIGGYPDQAPAGGAAPDEPDPLTAYLFELCENQYMPETVIARMRDLHDWRHDCPGCAGLARLYAYLDGLADIEERRRRFVAVRSFVRWLAGKGHIPSDWTERASVQRVLDGKGQR